MSQSPVFIRSFVRREGRFTKAQRAALQEYWPQYGVDIDQNKIKLEKIFNNTQPVVLDIGFGNGESLLTLAKQYPNLNFLGVEVYRPGIGSLLRKLSESSVENIRVINADVVELLQNNFINECFKAILVWFPDPWPKKRHHKRRLIQAPFLNLVAEKLVSKGELNIATDWQPYAEHIQEMLSQCAWFENTQTPKVITCRPQTKFEKRGEKLGHKVFAQVYVKKTN